MRTRAVIAISVFVIAILAGASAFGAPVLQIPAEVESGSGGPEAVAGSACDRHVPLFGGLASAVRETRTTADFLSGIMFYQHRVDSAEAALRFSTDPHGGSSHPVRELPAPPGAWVLLATGFVILLLRWNRRRITRSLRALAAEGHEWIAGLPEAFSACRGPSMALQSILRCPFAGGQEERFEGFTAEIDFAGLLRCITGAGGAYRLFRYIRCAFYRRFGLDLQAGRLFLLGAIRRMPLRGCVLESGTFQGV